MAATQPTRQPDEPLSKHPDARLTSTTVTVCRTVLGFCLQCLCRSSNGWSNLPMASSASLHGSTSPLCGTGGRSDRRANAVGRSPVRGPGSITTADVGGRRSSSDCTDLEVSMKARRVVFAFVALCLLCAPVGAQEQRGAIQGTATDNSGAILPGVLIELTSPSLVGGPARPPIPAAPTPSRRCRPASTRSRRRSRASPSPPFPRSSWRLAGRYASTWSCR